MEASIVVPEIPGEQSYDRSTYRMVHIARQILQQNGKDANDVDALSRFTGYSVNQVEDALRRLNDIWSITL